MVTGDVYRRKRYVMDSITAVTILMRIQHTALHLLQVNEMNKI